MEDPARRVLHQSGGLRGLRRLLGAVELHLGRAAGDRVRPQAHHQPVDLQQGLFLRQGLLPVLRHRRRRRACASARRPNSATIGDLPEPASKPPLEQPYNIAVGGVGGTGVLTIGALLGMAAHIEGKASMILDMSGLAQKGGAVLSHVRLSEHTADVTCSRIVTGTADLVLAADEVVAALEGDHHALRLRPHRWYHQQPSDPDRGLHPQPRLQFPEPQGEQRAGDRAAQGLRVLRFHQAGRGAARRFHRHQHDDDGLCLSEGLAAARRPRRSSRRSRSTASRSR